MKYEYDDHGKVRVSVTGDDGKTYKSCWGNNAVEKEAEARGLAQAHCDIWAIPEHLQQTDVQQTRKTYSEQDRELDYSTYGFSYDFSHTPKEQKYHVFWEGWVILVLLAIAIFIALRWQAGGGGL